jgi:hypothetical protein
MTAALKKQDPPIESPADPTRVSPLHADDDLREVVEEVATKTRAKIEGYKKVAAEHLAMAADLERRLQTLIQQSNISQAPPTSGSTIIGNWHGIEPAVALKEYLRQFPLNQKLDVADVVADLERGGCQLYQKARPGKHGSVPPQVEKERKIFIVVARNKDMDGDPDDTRKLWRVS